MKKEIIEAIRNGKLYDFIANNWWKIDKEELKDILLEYIFASDGVIDIDCLAMELEDRL